METTDRPRLWRYLDPRNLFRRYDRTHALGPWHWKMMMVVTVILTITTVITLAQHDWVTAGVAGTGAVTCIGLLTRMGNLAVAGLLGFCVFALMVPFRIWAG